MAKFVELYPTTKNFSEVVRQKAMCSSKASVHTGHIKIFIKLLSHSAKLLVQELASRTTMSQEAMVLSSSKMQKVLSMPVKW